MTLNTVSRRMFPLPISRMYAHALAQTAAIPTVAISLRCAAPSTRELVEVLGADRWMESPRLWAAIKPERHERLKRFMRNSFSAISSYPDAIATATAANREDINQAIVEILDHFNNGSVAFQTHPDRTTVLEDFLKPRNDSVDYHLTQLLSHQVLNLPSHVKELKRNPESTWTIPLIHEATRRLVIILKAIAQLPVQS